MRLGEEDGRWRVEWRVPAVAALRKLHQQRLQRRDDAEEQREARLHDGGGHPILCW